MGGALKHSKKLIQKLKDSFESIGQIQRSKVLESIEWEYEELEHVFALLTMGFFTGISSPPMHISFELMPLMEKELILMSEKVDTAASPLSQLFSVLDVT